MHMFGGGYGGGFGMIFMLLFWGIIIGLAFWLIREFFGKSSVQQQEDSALEIIKKRFASGEINKVEYEALRKELK